MNHDVFISYSSKNPEAAQAICHVLEENGIKCWMAPRDIPPGYDYGDLIDTAILECKVFLFVYSRNSLVSPWCKGELNVAFSEGKTIVPYRIDSTPTKGAVRVILNQTHWIDSFPDFRTHFDELIQTIGHIVGVDITKSEKHTVILSESDQPTIGPHTKEIEKDIVSKIKEVFVNEWREIKDGMKEKHWIVNVLLIFNCLLLAVSFLLFFVNGGGRHAYPLIMLSMGVYALLKNNKIGLWVFLSGVLLYMMETVGLKWLWHLVVDGYKSCEDEIIALLSIGVLALIWFTLLSLIRKKGKNIWKVLEKRKISTMYLCALFCVVCCAIYRIFMIYIL